MLAKIYRRLTSIGFETSLLLAKQVRTVELQTKQTKETDWSRDP